MIYSIFNHNLNKVSRDLNNNNTHAVCLPGVNVFFDFFTVLFFKNVLLLSRLIQFFPSPISSTGLHAYQPIIDKVTITLNFYFDKSIIEYNILFINLFLLRIVSQGLSKIKCLKFHNVFFYLSKAVTLLDINLQKKKKIEISLCRIHRIVLEPCAYSSNSDRYVFLW